MKITNLRNSPEFETLKLTIFSLLTRPDEEIIFSPSNGNWGDALINYGTRQLLNESNISWQEISKYEHKEALGNNSYRDRLVIIGGGGSWSRNGQLARQITSDVAKTARNVVVLPTTFDLPKVEETNVTYFARDKFSSLKHVPEALFAHDMAFYTELEVPDVPNKAWRLFAMRDDKEGFGHGHHFPQNIDVSRLGDGTYQFVDPFFNIPNNFKVVSTDRMHVGIASSMLGLQVNLVRGNYPKTQDVFDSSIAPNFPRTRMRTIEELLAWF